VVHLGIHATSGGVVDDMRDAVNALSQVPEVAIESGKDVANAGQALQRVVEPDEAAVHGVALQEVVVHDEHARGGDGAA